MANENNNRGVLTLIIQLSLSVLIAYLFSVKYKDVLIKSLSNEVYYQSLVVTTIAAGYLAEAISKLVYAAHIKIMCLLSKEYNTAYLQKLLNEIYIKEGKTLSPEYNAMFTQIKSVDHEAEVKIASIKEQMDKLKSQNKKQENETGK